MKPNDSTEWAIAGLKGVSVTVFADAVGWVEAAGLAKAVLLAVVTTVGSYATKKLLQYMEPKTKKAIQKIKSFIKQKKQ